MGSDFLTRNPHIVRGELKGFLWLSRRFFVVAEVDAHMVECRFRFV